MQLPFANRHETIWFAARVLFLFYSDPCWLLPSAAGRWLPLLYLRFWVYKGRSECELLLWCLGRSGSRTRCSMVVWDGEREAGALLTNTIIRSDCIIVWTPHTRNPVYGHKKRSLVRTYSGAFATLIREIKKNFDSTNF